MTSQTLDFYTLLYQCFFAKVDLVGLLSSLPCAHLLVLIILFCYSILLLFFRIVPTFEEGEQNKLSDVNVLQPLDFPTPFVNAMLGFIAPLS